MTGLCSDAGSRCRWQVDILVNVRKASKSRESERMISYSGAMKEGFGILGK